MPFLLYDPAKGFSVDMTRGDGIYKAREIDKNHTQKVKEAIVLYPATEQHPAQTQLLDKDVVTGRMPREQEWSALITPADKAALINRVEVVGRAVRRARSRANEVEVDKNVTVGKSILNYIFGK